MAGTDDAARAVGGDAHAVARAVGYWARHERAVVARRAAMARASPAGATDAPVGADGTNDAGLQRVRAADGAERALAARPAVARRAEARAVPAHAPAVAALRT